MRGGTASGRRFPASPARVPPGTIRLAVGASWLAVAACAAPAVAQDAGTVEDRFGARPSATATAHETFDLMNADYVIGVPVTARRGRVSARLNCGATDPAVLSAVLTRFGRVAIDDLDRAVEELRRRGQTRLSERVQARLFAFGSGDGGGSAGYRVVSLRHVVGFLTDHLRRHWDVLRHAQIRDPAFGFLATLEKAR